MGNCRLGRGGNVRVLLVEDEARIAAFVRQGLQEEQYVVDLAEDGEGALLFAEQTVEGAQCIEQVRVVVHDGSHRVCFQQCIVLAVQCVQAPRPLQQRTPIGGRQRDRTLRQNQ